MVYFFKNCITTYILHLSVRMQISFIYSNQIYKISSFILFAKKYVDTINVISFEYSQQLSEYCNKLGANLSIFDKNDNFYSKTLENKSCNEMIFINLEEISFSKLDFILNYDRSKEVDAYFVNQKNNVKIINNKEKCIKNLDSIKNLSWVYFNKKGIEKFLKNSSFSDIESINFNLDKYVENTNSNKLKTEISISRLNKPLIFFGIPGLVLIFSSFILVSNVVSRYDSIDSVSLGTAIITIGTTVVGTLSLMSAIISYVLGKQTEFLLTNYSE